VAGETISRPRSSSRYREPVALDHEGLVGLAWGLTTVGVAFSRPRSRRPRRDQRRTIGLLAPSELHQYGAEDDVRGLRGSSPLGGLHQGIHPR